MCCGGRFEMKKSCQIAYNNHDHDEDKIKRRFPDPSWCMGGSLRRRHVIDVIDIDPGGGGRRAVQIYSHHRFWYTDSYVLNNLSHRLMNRGSSLVLLLDMLEGCWRV